MGKAQPHAPSRFLNSSMPIVTMTFFTFKPSIGIFKVTPNGDCKNPAQGGGVNETWVAGLGLGLELVQST